LKSTIAMLTPYAVGYAVWIAIAVLRG